MWQKGHRLRSQTSRAEKLAGIFSSFSGPGHLLWLSVLACKKALFLLVYMLHRVFPCKIQGKLLEMCLGGQGVTQGC